MTAAVAAVTAPTTFADISVNSPLSSSGDYDPFASDANDPALSFERRWANRVRSGALVSARTTSRTPNTISAAETSSSGLIGSDNSNHPSSIATSGLTYAYVDVNEIGAFCSSHV